MKSRLVVRKTSGIVESDKQLEIWCRVVLMRFDQKELASEDHLNEITKNLEATSELGPKLQALQALVLFGERAGTQVDKVVPLLKDEDPLVLAAVLATLASMGVEGKPAIADLENTEKFWVEKLEKRKKEEDYKKAVVNLKPDEVKRSHREPDRGADAHGDREHHQVHQGLEARQARRRYGRRCSTAGTGRVGQEAVEIRGRGQRKSDL